MDVNGTKFHLLLGRPDWGNCKTDTGESLDLIWHRNSEGETVPEQKFDWNSETSEITLQPLLFKFKASPKDKKTDLKDRRGAARDRYGNWFWIDETGTKIKVLSVGSKNVSDFYPASESDCENGKESDFTPLDAPKKPVVVSFRGLAITIDHYLVVGTIEPAGLLIFDLFSAGEPQQRLWREDIAFKPFDISARFCGGAFVLDRENKRYWTLDRTFSVAGELPSRSGESEVSLQPFEKIEAFQPIDQSESERKYYKKLPPEKFYAELALNKDPISIEALPDETVLILNAPEESEEFSVIDRYFGTNKLDELNTDTIKSFVKNEEDATTSPPEVFRLRGFDIAFVAGSDEEQTRDRLFIVSEEGNQAFAFNLICKEELQIYSPPQIPSNVIKRNFELQPIAEYFPMRLYGGKGFVAVDGKVYYDFTDRWLPLVKQNRQRFIAGARLETQIFDGKEPNCVWHRLMLDGCMPAETKIDIYSRTSADIEMIETASWQKEPNIYLRGNGSEQPFVNNAVSKEKGKGTWELLVQNAKDRYLQLRLDFSGNGQKSPRISALRIYYPRFSYLENYLPSIYREDEQSAFFLDRFLANFEGFYTSIEGRIAAAQALFDVRSVPPDALEWLAGWFGIILEPNWDESKRRMFIKKAVEFYQYRGTMRGIRAAIRLAIYPCAEASFFDSQTSEQKKLDPIRIVERFQTRRIPEIIPSDFVGKPNQPQIVQRTDKWKPAQGADVLNQRYRKVSDDESTTQFPLVSPTEPKESAIWDSFALSVLGFVPSSAAAAEQKQWQGFLSAEYQSSISSLNQAQASSYSNFGEIFLPRGVETNPKLKADWKNFIVETSVISRNRKLWQDFLARRYRRIGQLNQSYGTAWDSFEYVSLLDRLPLSNVSLGDWYLFEIVVLPMRSTAHRFTVLIPATIGGNKPDTVEQQKAKLELVRRVVELEKPAHTVCDFRHYWNLFRLGEVRLGADTLLGLGSRDPRLSPELVIGQGFVGESRIGTAMPEKYASRYVLGSENVEKTRKSARSKDEK